MRLGPHEPGIHEMNFRETFQPLQTHSQQLPRLESASHPGSWGLEVSDRGEREESGYEGVGKGLSKHMQQAPVVLV